MKKTLGGLHMKTNLTEGNVFKKLIFFSLPYLMSYFLQTLYGMADLFIIGQYGSVADITAVSIGSQVMHMLTVIIVGLAMGSTVSIGRYVGAGNERGAAKSVGNTITLFMVISVFATFVLLLCAKPITVIMSVPSEAVGGTLDYLRICFIGIPFITAYNIISSVLRGMGDSKSPMYFIAIACVVNIVLDFIFIGKMNIGTAGAALGTTLSQTVSVAAALIYIRKKNIGISVKAADLRPSKKLMGQILRVGIPVALQDGFIQISFVLITIFANRRGLDDAAAVGIVEKIIGIFFLPPSSMLSAVSALAAQNLGAAKPARARRTLWYAIAVAMGFGLAVSVITQFFTEDIVGIFGGDSTVRVLGGQYLRSYVFDCVFAGASFCFSGYFCALEKSEISFMHNVISIVLVRIPVAYYASKTFADTLYPMGLASPLGSLLSAIICVAAYIHITKKQLQLRFDTERA